MFKEVPGLVQIEEKLQIYRKMIYSNIKMRFKLDLKPAKADAWPLWRKGKLAGKLRPTQF